jgi:NADPH-dependent 2,4-dienoyl-CoA reductase/sulfur reductase-like enzyme
VARRRRFRIASPAAAGGRGPVRPPRAETALETRVANREDRRRRPRQIRRRDETGREERMASAAQSLDAVVVGAGFSGMHMLKSLRDRLGLRVRVYEAGETVGGTWCWNRYPGARCDSDSYWAALEVS